MSATKLYREWVFRVTRAVLLARHARYGGPFPSPQRVQHFCVYQGLGLRRIMRRMPHPMRVARECRRQSAVGRD